MQDEQRDIVFAADLIDESPTRYDRLPLVRNDHQVVSVGEIHRLEQRVEPLLLDVQHSSDVAVRAYGFHMGTGQSGRLNLSVCDRVQVIANLKRSASDGSVGVRLLEMAARVIDDVPIK